MTINNISISEAVGSIVNRNFGAAEVFNRLKIDFCCNGNKTLDHFCMEKSLDPDTMIMELETAFNRENEERDFYNNWSAGRLIYLIKMEHHTYVCKNEVIISQCLAKINKVHGENHPELAEVMELFAEAMAELIPHMNQEENLLFPMIEHLFDTKSTPNEAEMDQLTEMIETMMDDHQTEGQIFKRISELTENYTIPTDACASYRLAFQKLPEFEKNLRKHIHLENNILFPKVLFMNEKRMQEAQPPACCVLRAI